MRQMMLSFLTLLLYAEGIHAACMLKGVVTDVRNEPAVNATVELILHNKTMATSITDFDGAYCFNRIGAEKYNIRFSYSGDTMLITGVKLRSGQTVILNNRFTSKPDASRLKQVTVTTSRPFVERVIDYPTPSSRTVKTKDQIDPAATINATDMAALGTQSYHAKNGTAASLGGGRPSSQQLYVVDNTIVTGYYNPSTETYQKEAENDFRTVKASPLSTLSVDVDRASYSNIRRFINQGQQPPADAVRIEEMINYFNYNYPQPAGSDPIAITTETTTCPWNTAHKLLHIGIQARSIKTDKLPPSNLVFLIDVSGSMEAPNKLPLLKASLKLLTDNLRARDRVSIIVYAGNAGLVLPPTPGNERARINEALDRLQAGGSTAGGQGLLLAYKTAEEHFIKGGNNRVLLATDGDFNVGVSNDNDLEALITQQRSKGIFLTCLGFGMGNYKDAKMELLADKGNGNYAYIDNIQEARKTLVSEFGGTLFTVAKDVKAQIEFNPALVQGYRLIGYENRLLHTEDFKDDRKDAGEMGAGHTVTILYELIPAGINSKWLRPADALKYQQPAPVPERAGNELATVRFRYKAPDGNVSREIAHPITGNHERPLVQTAEYVRFAAAVAMWGLLLKDSPYKEAASYSNAILLAESARGSDADGYRAECIRLMKSVRSAQ